MTGGVDHDSEARRFTTVVDGDDAYLAYEMLDAATMEATRTFTPRTSRGRGVAARLVRAALDHARERGWRVVPTCWYVAQWIDRHPEYRDLLAD